MDLILWRHAEAEEAAPGADDLARALTRKGQRQAERMSEWLQRRLAESTRVLASPALRCRQTVEALGRDFRTLDSLGPAADADDILDAARWPDAREPVLVIGHQPTLGRVAARLLCAGDADLSIRKGAVWWLRSDADGKVALRAAIGPDFV